MNGYISVEYIQCQCFLALHCSCKYMMSFISVLIMTGSCSCTITLQLIFLCPPFSTHQIYIYSYHKVGTEEVQLCIFLAVPFSCIVALTFIATWLCSITLHLILNILHFLYIITSIFTLNKMQNKGNAFEEDSMVNFLNPPHQHGQGLYRACLHQ